MTSWSTLLLELLVKPGKGGRVIIKLGMMEVIFLREVAIMLHADWGMRKKATQEVKKLLDMVLRVAC